MNIMELKGFFYVNPLALLCSRPPSLSSAPPSAFCSFFTGPAPNRFSVSTVEHRTFSMVPTCPIPLLQSSAGLHRAGCSVSGPGDGTQETSRHNTCRQIHCDEYSCKAISCSLHSWIILPACDRSSSPSSA
jgi:hypothetical protein